MESQEITSDLQAEEKATANKLHQTFRKEEQY
jgi:hypothetical protein